MSEKDISLIDNNGDSSKDIDETKVLTLDSFRQQKIDQRRKELGRIIFDISFGVDPYIEATQTTEIFPINIIDFSKNGISFALNKTSTIEFQKGDKIVIRLYFVSKAYVPILCEIKNITIGIQFGQSQQRYGALIEPDTQGQKVIENLVNFTWLCSDSSVVDSKIIKKL